MITDKKIELNVVPLPEFGEIESYIAACLRGKLKAKQLLILRQRDFSIVLRVLLDGGRGSVIYKKVIAPWDKEAHIMRFVANSKLPNTPLLFGAKNGVDNAVIVQEDIGTVSLKERCSRELAMLTGYALAQTHDAAADLSSPFPPAFARYDTENAIRDCFEKNAASLVRHFPDITADAVEDLLSIGADISAHLGDSQMCLQHGDAYAENVILRDGNAPVFIDWSYFSFVGPRIFDVATLMSGDRKNGSLPRFSEVVFDSYCEASNLSKSEFRQLVKPAYRFSRLLFLQWLLTRVDMGITQTTVGHVRPLIGKVVAEIIG